MRPNSIAFSTLPNFDLSSDSSSSPDCKSTTSEKGNKSVGSSAYKRMFMAECNKYVTSAVQTFSKNVALENALGRARSFENCRKSRSLDDWIITAACVNYMYIVIIDRITFFAIISVVIICMSFARICALISHKGISTFLAMHGSEVFKS